MDIITLGLSKIASGIGPFFLLLGLLIFVHELGHYLVAVYFGVRVETFSLGFGKKIFSYKRGDTTYCLSLIPLGGYVKMFGDDPTAEISEAEKKYSFLHQPVWPRIAIVLAGPLMNLFFAILIFAIVGMLGEQVPGSKIGDIRADTVAYEIGFRSGDSIKSINSIEVKQWADVKKIIENSADKELNFSVARDASKEIVEFKATPQLGKNEFIFTTQREVGQIAGLETESAAAMIGVSDKKSIAYIAGLRTFDVIEKINGTDVTYWRDIESRLQATLALEKATLSVKNYGEENKVSREVTLSLTAINNLKPLLSQIGIQKSDLFLMNIREKSPAQMSGLKNGDLVTHIDGKPVYAWQEVLDRIKSYKSTDKGIAFKVLRDGTEMDFVITPEKIDLPTEQGAMESRYAIGVVPAIMSLPSEPVLLRQTNPLAALFHGVEQSWVWSKLIAISLVRLVQNEVSARNIGGVITIGRVASKSFEVGAVAFLKMMAIISINLFLLNLLPVPVLDGGHLVFFTIEALKGAPISFKKLEIAQQVGLVLLLSLMLFALFNDITHLISSW